MFFVPVVDAAIAAPASTSDEARPAATPSSLPDGVRQMIEAAIASGDDKAVGTVLRLARTTHPSAAAEFDDIERRWKVQIAARAPEPVPARKQWRTQLELGASRSTGRTSYLGALGSILVEGEGERWRHKAQARFELQQGRNIADVERGSASWQPGYKFDDRLYLYGLGQVEADALQGFDARYTAGGGLGFTVLNRSNAKLDLEGGPALRLVDRVGGDTSTSLSGRASINLRWAIRPTLELNQASSLFVEGSERSASALTSLDTQVIGPLKARLSYDVRYESRLASGDHLDTLSRATLVFSF